MFFTFYTSAWLILKDVNVKDESKERGGEIKLFVPMRIETILVLGLLGSRISLKFGEAM